MRILLLSADFTSAPSIEAALSRAGLNIFVTDSGEDGLDLARRYDHDAVILDAELCDMAGMEALRNLRKARIPTPVLFLSDDASVAAKVTALQAGADEYMSRHCNMAELIARVRALVRRFHGYAQSAVTLGDVTINLASKKVSAKGEQIHLSGKEYQILELLTLRKGSTLSKETIITHLYHDGDGPASRTVDLFICRLRKKLSAATGGMSCIETINQRGYQLRVA